MSPTSALIRVCGLYPGARFAVPRLMVGAPSWWTVHRLVDLPGGRVRVILAEATARGRRYRLELEWDDLVVWSTLPVRPVAVSGLGHHVWCSSCGTSWGFLPVTVSNAECGCCDPARCA